MNFLTASVDVKVDDTKLKTQLTRIRSSVTKSIDKIKAGFGKMAAAFKGAFDKMVRYAKWGAVALTAALALATRAAMKQEDAVFLLGAALKATGEYTEQLMRRYKAFASSIQQITTYGDEEVLMLMKLEKALGVSTDKLEEAVEMSIGLAAATDRDVRSMAMYIALAMQGEFTMLRRYIPALRSTTDETKQLQIITEFAANGFKIAQAQAETTSGALKQMKNAIGDVAEVIGAALLPGIKAAAKAVKTWAEENRERIGGWSKMAIDAVGAVKDTFLDYIRVLTSKMPDVSWVEIMLDAFEALTVATIKVSRHVQMLGVYWKGFVAGLHGSVAAIYEISDAMTNLDELTKSIGIREKTYKELAEEHRRKAAELTRKAIDETARFYDMQTKAEVFFDDIHKRYHERRMARRQQELLRLWKFAESWLDEALVQESAEVEIDEAAQRRAAEHLRREQWVASQIEGEYRGAAKRIEYAMGDAFQGITEGAMTMQQGLQSIIRGITQSLTQLAADILAKVMMMKALTAMGAGAGFMSLLGYGPAPVAAAPVGHRGISPHYIPKLHGGLSSNEFPAILERGETVIPKEGPAGAPTIVNFNVSAIDAAGTYQFLSKNRKTLALMIQNSLQENHPLRRSR